MKIKVSGSVMRMRQQYHIYLSAEQGAQYAILPGDPGRVKQIADFLEKPRFVASNREFTTYCAFLEGKSILNTSTGIGGPSTAIALEELASCGVHTVIRVGTCGAMQPEIMAGDLILPTAAVRMEGTSREYVPIEFPAVSDFSILQALTKASQSLPSCVHTGIVQSKDSFYGQHRPDTMPVGQMLQTKWDAWIKAGVLASEMECAALFTVAAVRKIRAGAVLTALWNQQRQDKGNQNKPIDHTSAIQTAINALRLLIQKNG